MPESVLDGGVGAPVVELGGPDCVTVTADDAVMAGCRRSDSAAVLTPPKVCASVSSRLKRAPLALMRVALPTPQTICTEDTSVPS